MKNEARGALDQRKFNLSDGRRARRAGDIPGGLGPVPGYEVVVERTADICVLRFTESLPHLQGTWSFQAERELMEDEDRRGFAPVRLEEVLSPR
ncbi:MAG: hypothetical protein GY772_13615 [bacterium]|nr:hypothetical protein [bacterium]